MSVNLPSTELCYIALRTALAKYKRALPDLNATEMAEIIASAQREHQVHNLVLASPRAAAVVITEVRLNQAIAEIQDRYSDSEAFKTDLKRNGLNADSLQSALRRELHVETVLEHVATEAKPVTDSEIEAFYTTHRASFDLPETRTARQILITINADYAENTRETAQQRINTLAGELKQHSERFSTLAEQHSECPTAIEGGLLGRVKPQQLYPELDAVLFALPEGEISAVVESELGFHLLYCEQIHPSKNYSLEQVRHRIQQTLEQQHRQQHQMAWLRSLQNSATSA